MSALLLRGTDSDTGLVAHQNWTINAAAYGAIPPQPNISFVLDVRSFKAIGVYVPDTSRLRLACYVGNRTNHRGAGNAFVLDEDLLFMFENDFYQTGQYKICPIPSGVSGLTLLVNLATMVGLHTIGIDLFAEQQQPASKTTFS